jgi:oligopeptidase B
MRAMKLKSIPNPPVAKKVPHECQAHGQTWVDDYAWLRASNWQQAMREPDTLPDDIKAYLNAENDYCARAMADAEALQQQLVAEMRGRIQETDNSVPEPDGPYSYSYRYIEGAEHPVYIRTDRAGNNEQVLLDVNAEARDHEYFDLGVVDYSPTHDTLAWSRDTSGAEYYQLVFRRLAHEAATEYDYVIDEVDSACWADGSTLFYTRVDENHRPGKVYRHVLGTNPADDVLVYEEHDARFFCSVWRSRSGEYVFISSGMNDQDEIHFVPVAELNAEPRVIEPRAEGIEYTIEHQGDRFLILTNADDALDFKLVQTAVTQPGREHWQEFLPYKPGRMIKTVEAYRDWVMWLEQENALPRLCFMDAGGATQSIAFDEEAYSLSLSAGEEYVSDQFRFRYSSPTTPTQTFEYDMSGGTRELLKEQAIPSGHNSADYIARRITARSHDGEEVPVTVLHHRDTPIDGSAPCLLYGYGSYGSSTPAYFSGNRLSLVDRGFIYAIAHVRGGQEKGRAWYEAAKFERKTNSFHDLIASAETLIAQGFTRNAGVVIHGGSAGGLLVAAAVNMRPSLFGGVIADVPFVDVLNTILDDTLPLTPGEWSQWGNPIASADAFEHIRSYSPYDNIEAAEYPPMLVTAGVSDPRVTYWEPAKWVAKLRATKTDNNLLMLKTNMASGHYGKTGRFAALEDSARTYAFAIGVVGAAG